MNARLFKWRLPNISEYDIIISEILLQRTKAETIAKFYGGFLNRFPNWQSLANANLADIENYLMPIGLYRQRAKKLHELSKNMVATPILPKERVELEKMPYMGQYIANAVELLIHKNPKPLLDVNMARVLERYFGARKLVDIRYDQYLQTLAQTVVSHQQSKELNWAILDFSALICKIKNPLCEICPIKAECLYYR